MQQDDPLAGLRALHLPPQPVSFWADFGVAAAAGLGLALIVALALRALLRPRPSLAAAARAEFERARTLPAPERRAAQATILRRVVRSRAGDEAARATGADWAAALDGVFGTDLFTARAGRVFADGLYARPPAEDPELDRELSVLFAKLGR
ncbi:DUF4381 family protein [Hansschlegelia plantiphila]|uniref:DUF4381 domain-containing protein n=1 Tax=Hansschlegelia plantiphila TaxID=374655 RepID=A0A9W6J1X2_9HYPH|nr:DUF4381 family protein [Hansschlegelia plantiphila]GLK69182.1 hypothetical protein GCM10008179_28200 [Hansschlegelia plantiphila]